MKQKDIMVDLVFGFGVGLVFSNFYSVGFTLIALTIITAKSNAMKEKKK